MMLIYLLMKTEMFSCMILPYIFLIKFQLPQKEGNLSLKMEPFQHLILFIQKNTFFILIKKCYLQEDGTYGSLFLFALRNLGILCIGLYRFRDTNESSSSPSSKRYVITNPPEDFKLLATDQVCTQREATPHCNNTLLKAMDFFMQGMKLFLLSFMICYTINYHN